MELSRWRGHVAATDVTALLSSIGNYGWFTDDMYSTAETPCGQCYTYFINVSYQGQLKNVQAVDGGTAVPGAYWYVVGSLSAILPKFSPAP